MTTRIIQGTSVLVVMVWLGMIAMLGMPASARALTIDQTDITVQTSVVKSELLSTMEEYVKLLQMMLIMKLEARLAALQAAQ